MQVPRLPWKHACIRLASVTPSSPSSSIAAGVAQPARLQHDSRILVEVSLVAITVSHDQFYTTKLQCLPEHVQNRSPKIVYCM